jgi:hypothetical protein
MSFARKLYFQNNFGRRLYLSPHYEELSSGHMMATCGNCEEVELQP